MSDKDKDQRIEFEDDGRIVWVLFIEDDNLIRKIKLDNSDFEIPAELKL